MTSRWENIVIIARDIDEAFAVGRAPEPELVMRLARAVIDFQQHLAGPRIASRTEQPPRPSVFP